MSMILDLVVLFYFLGGGTLQAAAPFTFANPITLNDNGTINTNGNAVTLGGTITEAMHLPSQETGYLP